MCYWLRQTYPEKVQNVAKFVLVHATFSFLHVYNGCMFFPASLMVGAVLADSPTLEPVMPVPSARHLAWHELETYAFVHFGPNTFTGLEWGHGTEDPKVFHPTAFDARQWARVAREVGLKGIILTAKHHDGFCLWPTKHSSHSVAASPWKGGQGDVLRELSQACKAEGILLGVYLSPWDRNHPTYGSDEYNRVFAAQLEEVLTQYGPVFEVWWDGANGEGPTGKRQEYDWDLFISVVRKHQPHAVIFSDAGPDVRWVGNERGYSSPTSWAMIPSGRYSPGTPHFRELSQGSEHGDLWVPAECNFSIRPGWFWRESENSQVKTPEQLFDLYERSVGQNGSFHVNIPPDTRGLWHENDVAALRAWRKKVDAVYGVDLAEGATASASPVRGPSFAASGVLDDHQNTMWAAPDGTLQGTIELRLPQPRTFDRVMLREPIHLGQRVRQFEVDAFVDGGWKTIGTGTTVGWKRKLRCERVTSDRVRVRILDSRATPAISRVSLHDSTR